MNSALSVTVLRVATSVTFTLGYSSFFQNIYSRFGPLTHSACCAVLHHSPCPSWYDEIKIRLPHRLSPSHHLLFIFKHISIEGAKKKEGGAESNVGYAWLPLISKGRYVK